jgi:uncharacterized protein (TIGR02246 family)
MRSPTAHPPDHHGVPEAVVAELTARVDRLARAQRGEDVAAFVALFSPDATWVTGAGYRLVGRDAIAAFTATVLPGAFARGSVRYEVEMVRGLAADVVVTGVAQTYLDDEGRPTARGRPTYVWTRHGGEWLISVGQNTPVPD